MEQVNNIPLTNYITILTKNQYLKRIAINENNKTCIFAPKETTSVIEICTIIEHAHDSEGYYLVPKTHTTINELQYIAYYLNSYTGIYAILYDQAKKVFGHKIKKNALSNCLITITGEEELYYYSLINTIISCFHNSNGKMGNAATLSTFCEIRNALSMEQAFPSIFKENSIFIFTNWTKFIDSYPDIIQSQNYQDLYYELIKPDNELYNNIKKMNILINKMD